tara:strand:+ start:598 stop:849 length:252 start_codon:yes stop_codon:yes gene_type:complete
MDFAKNTVLFGFSSGVIVALLYYIYLKYTQEENLDDKIKQKLGILVLLIGFSNMIMISLLTNTKSIQMGGNYNQEVFTGNPNF